jgi:hypothetical protein
MTTAAGKVDTEVGEFKKEPPFKELGYLFLQKPLIFA